jgi:prolipoprotein diacylglyceryltransferase
LRPSTRGILAVSERDGVVFAAYALLYAVLRFGVSFLRADNEPLLGLRLAQLIALGFIALSTILFSHFWRISGRQRPSTYEQAITEATVGRGIS